MNKKLLLFSFLFISIWISSCEEPLIISKEDIMGKWLIVDAKRNRKQTKTLKGAWIKIDMDTMTDNFISGEESYPYDLNGNKLNHKNITEQTYNIKRWENDTLVLTSKMESHRFEFILVKETPVQ